MAEVQETRRKLQIATATLVVLNVALAAVFFSPIVGSQRSRKEVLNRLWKEQQQKTREVEPLRNIGDKITTARQQIDNFYKTRLPGQDSAISEALANLSKQSGVKIGEVKYRAKDPEPVGLRPVEIEADFSGDYFSLYALSIRWNVPPYSLSSIASSWVENKPEW